MIVFTLFFVPVLAMLYVVYIMLKAIAILMVALYESIISRH